MTQAPKIEEQPRRGWGIVFGGALAVVAAGVVLYLHNGGAGKSAQPLASAVQLAIKGLNTGEVAAFSLRDAPVVLPAITFKDAAGKDFDLKAWRGKVVLLNLWATWCAPCRHEMPALDSLKAELGGADFDVLALATDRGGIDKPKKFWTETGIKSLALYLDTGDATHALGILGMPTTLLIDREGREIGRLVGPAEWASPEAKALLKAALKG